MARERGGAPARVSSRRGSGTPPDGSAGQGGRTRGCWTRTWPVAAGARGREPSWGLWQVAGEFLDRAARWARAEVGPGRLMPWLPVAFGAGIVLYFTAPREPLAWAPVALLAALAAGAIAVRARPVGFPVLL